MPDSEHTPIGGPSPERIEAWLAGELDPEQSAEVERQLGAAEAASAEPDGDFRDLDAEPPSSEVDQLIGQIFADGDPAPPDAEDWRSILEPADDPGLLGSLGGKQRYEVESVIAVGGMSIVFKGRDPALDRPVALKALTPGLAANHLTRERFLREARVAAKLDHENILPIYGVHDDASVPFFAMKFIEGGTLQDGLEDKPLPVERIAAIARQITSALSVAHEAGVVHRDIKPANILLSADGETAWLCDFGIARSTEDPSLTYAGSIAGTPHYMAPEQATGEAVDERSDLFSLGAVLYHAATGKAPFPGETSTAVIRSVTTLRPAPARKLNPSLPKWLAALLERMLAKDPAERPGSAAEVLRVIEEKVVVRPAKSPRHWLALAAASLAVIAAIVFWPDAGNDVIGADIPPGVSIVGQEGSFTDLAAAVEAASDGDVLLISPETGASAGGVVVPAGKNLTLRAAGGEGARAELAIGLTGVGIHAHAPLTLEGIDFAVPALRDLSAVLRVADTSVRLVDCRFSEIAASPTASGVSPRLVELRDGASVVAERCEFAVSRADAFTLSGTGGPAKLRISGSEIAADHAVVVRGTAAAELEFKGSRFSGQHVVLGAGEALPPLTCAANDSVFTLARAAARVKSTAPTEVRGRFHWSGTGNRFPLGKATLLVSETRGRGGAFREFDLDGDTPRSGFVEIDGRRFGSLDEACDAAVDGSTLLLSGDLVCRRTIKTTKGATLHFRADADDPPTVFFPDPEALGLWLRGPATFEGIRFARRYATDSWRALSMISAGHPGPFRFEDCHFRNSPDDPANSSGVALGLQDVTSAELVRCTIFMPESAAFLIDHIDKDAGRQTVLTLRDCLIAATLSIFHRTADDAADTHVRADGCVFLGDRILQEGPRDHTAPVRLEISDSLIDMAKTCVEAYPEHMASLPENLVWEGRGNHHRPGLPVLLYSVSDQPKESPAESLAGLEVAAFAAASEGSREIETTVSPLFDRSQLAHPLSPGALLRALPATVQSPAREALQSLSGRLE